MTETVLVEHTDGVGWIRLNRPERRNALSRQLRSELATALAVLDADDEVRVAVLTATGAVFCAGADLKEPDADDRHPLSRGATRVSAPLDAFGKPLIAAINGPAFGGGLELVLATDIRVAARSARFGLPEVRIGSLPGSGGTQRLLEQVPQAVALAMLFTAEPIDAAAALRAGLVGSVVDDDALGHAVAELAARVARNAPLSLRAAKAAVRAARPAETTGMALERTLWALLSLSEDRQEGRRAFRERRTPRFRGR